MYSATAEFYDLLYSTFKDFGAEAAQVADIIRREHPRARTVLDVACGSGEHARLLTERHGLEVDGLDLDPAFVRIARPKLPRATVTEGDMTSFTLAKQFDVVLCLFSSIAYVRTLENVTRALQQFQKHLAPDGIVLVEPWFAPGVLNPGRITVNTATAGGITVSRMSRVEVEGRLSRLYFDYLIGRSHGIEHASEVHELGLFTVDEMLACFREAGLSVTYDEGGPSGRGLYLARAA